MAKVEIIAIFVPILFSDMYCEYRNNSTLISVIIVFRHGDRTITNPYPNDPYKDISFWPEGFGQLTNVGKVRHYQLGQWFRERYSDFLPSAYSSHDTRVQSTDVDRALMSAAVHLAGLYPPSGSQIWDQQLLWQPIPIHTIPVEEDAFLDMEKPCKRRDELMNNLLGSEKIQSYISEIVSESFIKYVTKNSGRNMSSIVDLGIIYETLSTEENYGYRLPDWVRPVYPNPLLRCAVFVSKLPCYNKRLTRLQVGPFLNGVVNNFQNATIHMDDSYQKYKIYSAHDTTIVNLMMSMGTYNDILPPFASALIFELKRTTDRHFVNLLYKNSTNGPYKLQVKGCEFDCSFEDFVRILKPVTVDSSTWEAECSRSTSDIQGGLV